MKDVKACISKHWPEAFQIAIRESTGVVRENGRKRRRVNLSEDENMAMFHFYRQHVEDDRVKAAEAIVVNARRAVMRSPLFSVLICAVILAFTVMSVFKNVAYPALVVLLCAFGCYLWYAARRKAAMIWRVGRKGDAAGALEKMCVVLASPFACASYPVLGGLIAAIGVVLYMIIFQ